MSETVVVPRKVLEELLRKIDELEKAVERLASPKAAKQ